MKSLSILQLKNIFKNYNMKHTNILNMKDFKRETIFEMKCGRKEKLGGEVFFSLVTCIVKEITTVDFVHRLK